MNTQQTYSPRELATTERQTGLIMAGWLDLDGALVPIFLRPGRTPAEQRALVLRLNGRQPTARPAEAA